MVTSYIFAGIAEGRIEADGYCLQYQHEFSIALPVSTATMSTVLAKIFTEAQTAMPNTDIRLKTLNCIFVSTLRGRTETATVTMDVNTVVPQYRRLFDWDILEGECWTEPERLGITA